MCKKNSGFTLVELSVVIVIIGLIVAGIVGGTGLVRSTKINKIISEVANIKSAYNSFYLTYNQVPGDFDKAYDYWGAACDAVAGDCNGSGNRLISWAFEGDLGSNSVRFDNETFRAWQHLFLAGLIDRRFTGESPGVNTTGIVTKEEIYYSSTGLARFWISTRKPYGGIFGKYSANNFLLSAGRTESHSLWEPNLTVLDAFNIDKKMDDSVANLGKVFSTSGLATTECSQNYIHATGSDYNFANLNNSSLYCQMAFVF